MMIVKNLSNSFGEQLFLVCKKKIGMKMFTNLEIICISTASIYFITWFKYSLRQQIPCGSLNFLTNTGRIIN